MCVGALLGIMNSLVEYFWEIKIPDFSVAGVLFWFMIGILLHELGHLFLGLVSGYRFTCFQLGNFFWFKEEGKIKFVFSKSFILGQCLMEPKEDFKEFNYFWYNFGGAFVNLLTVLICILIILAGNLNEFGDRFLMTGVFANGFYFLINTIPLPKTHNDGYNIQSASLSELNKRGIYAYLMINSALYKGKRYRDFMPFKVEKNVCLKGFKNFWTAQLVFFEYYRLVDLEEFAQAFEELQRLNFDDLPKTLKTSVKIEFLYHYLV